MSGLRLARGLRMRLDAELVQRGIVTSRERAKEAIKAGQVYVNGVKTAKASSVVTCDDVIELRGEVLRYVGRGGLKLEKALQVFGIDVQGKTCIDLGASTGGFTDCMLQAGAARVFAVDVGHGQLAAKLQDDARVVSLEGVDARAVTSEMLGASVEFAATDVSFISLKKVLPAIAGVLDEGACAVCLVKPQFEAGREHVGKKGVVRSPRIHEQVLERVMGCACVVGLKPIALDYSPVTGPEGNIEYLLLVRKSTRGCVVNEIAESIPQVVSAAHMALA